MRPPIRPFARTSSVTSSPCSAWHPSCRSQKYISTIRTMLPSSTRPCRAFEFLGRTVRKDRRCPIHLFDGLNLCRCEGLIPAPQGEGGREAKRRGRVGDHGILHFWNDEIDPNLKGVLTRIDE